MKVRNKYILIVIMTWGPCLALAVVFGLFVLKPRMQRVAALETELEHARNVYSQAIEATKKESQIRLSQTAEELHERASDFVLRLEAAPDLAFEIAELASRTQVGSFTMKPRAKRGLETLPNCDSIGNKQINLSFTSQFHQFAALLNALERHRPVLFIETFDISRPLIETASPEVKMELAVLVERPRSG